MRSCSETVALRGLSSPGAAEDWIGLERHWDEWVAAACAGRLRGSGGGPPLGAVFARSSSLWARAAELEALVGCTAGTLPPGLRRPRAAPPFPVGDGSAASLAAVAALNATFASLRGKQAALGDIVLLGPGNASAAACRAALAGAGAPPPQRRLAPPQPAAARRLRSASPSPPPSPGPHATGQLEGRGAVCLVGFLRTFASPPVYEGIARAARALGDVDVFAVVANGAGDTAKGQAGAVPSEQVAAARAHLQPREWVTAQPEMALPAACPNCLGQLAKFEQCMALVRSAERRDGGRYTWVVKMRPDCVPCGDVPPVASLRRPADNVALAAGGDLFVLYPRPLAEAVASGWRRVDCRRHHRVFGGNLTGCNHVAEAALRAAGGQSRTTGQFDCDIVRTAEGARSMFQFGKYALHGALWGDVEGWTPNRTLYKGSGVVAATATRFCGREWGGRYVSARSTFT